mmetsp:Transcript_32238/g.46987  ORF Transcript_32238/g.46987 Transcript_32238/m.46987 type:complete len:371 (+) Transcript_32238:52-1164(+)
MTMSSALTEDSECYLYTHIITGIASIVGHNDSNAEKEYDPYSSTMVACLFFIMLTFIVSTLSKNYSQVDKLWSITPVIYSWMCITDTRTLIMAILATIWGGRLTYNFYRRGGYEWPPWSGDEDYRWAYVQKGEFMMILTNPIVWNIFNFVFISFYQMVLLWLIATPSLVAYTMAHSSSKPQDIDCETPHGVYASYNPIGLDGIATLLFLLFVLMESIADNQQYAFQTEKYRQKNAGEKLTGYYADGFCQSGLYAVLRKPNYAAEQSIWIAFYLFGVASMNGAVENDQAEIYNNKLKLWWNWTALGWILLVSLFYSSGKLTEQITLKKYPLYKRYQKRVGMYIPFVGPFIWKMLGNSGDDNDDANTAKKQT